MRYLALTLVLFAGVGSAQAARGDLFIPPPVAGMSVQVRTSPGVVPRLTREAVAFEVSAAFADAGGGAIAPLLQELRIDIDRDASVDVGGVPRCERRQRAPQRTLDQIRRLCGAAIVGGGALEATLVFPENTPIPVTSDLLILNGGKEGGVITFYALARIELPSPSQLVMPIEIRRRRGPEGIRATLAVPPIADGHGYLTDLRIRLRRHLASMGGADGIFRLRCTDGETATDVRAGFTDGTLLVADASRPCGVRTVK